MVRILVPVAALFLCWITVFGSARVLPSTALSYPSISYSVDTRSYDNNAYKILIGILRRQMATIGTVYDGILVLPSHVPVTSAFRFLLLTIEGADSSYSITLAFDVTNANIVGFNVGTNSYLLEDVSEDIYDSPLFEDTNKARLPIGGRYDSLAAKGAFRENTTLGSYSFNDATIQLYNYGSNTSINIAPSFLVLIQIMSEGVRFKYIADELDANFEEGLIPNCDIISLEDNWNLLSAAIQTSENGHFSSPVILQYANCTTYSVSTVDEIKPNMGLLRDVDEQTIDWPYKGDLIKKLSSVV